MFTTWQVVPWSPGINQTTTRLTQALPRGGVLLTRSDAGETYPNHIARLQPLEPVDTEPFYASIIRVDPTTYDTEGSDYLVAVAVYSPDSIPIGIPKVPTVHASVLPSEIASAISAWLTNPLSSAPRPSSRAADDFANGTLTFLITPAPRTVGAEGPMAIDAVAVIDPASDDASSAVQVWPAVSSVRAPPAPTSSTQWPLMGAAPPAPHHMWATADMGGVPSAPAHSAPGHGARVGDAVGRARHGSAASGDKQHLSSSALLLPLGVDLSLILDAHTHGMLDGVMQGAPLLDGPSGSPPSAIAPIGTRTPLDVSTCANASGMDPHDTSQSVAAVASVVGGGVGGDVDDDDEVASTPDTPPAGYGAGSSVARVDWSAAGPGENSTSPSRLDDVADSILRNPGSASGWGTDMWDSHAGLSLPSAALGGIGAPHMPGGARGGRGRGEFGRGGRGHGGWAPPHGDVHGRIGLRPGPPGGPYPPPLDGTFEDPHATAGGMHPRYDHGRPYAPHMHGGRGPHGYDDDRERDSRRAGPGGKFAPGAGGAGGGHWSGPGGRGEGRGGGAMRARQQLPDGAQQQGQVVPAGSGNRGAAGAAGGAQNVRRSPPGRDMRSYDGFSFVEEPWCCFWMRSRSCTFRPSHIGCNRVTGRRYDPHDPTDQTGVCMYGRTCELHCDAAYLLVLELARTGVIPPPAPPQAIAPSAQVLASVWPEVHKLERGDRTPVQAVRVQRGYPVMATVRALASSDGAAVDMLAQVHPHAVAFVSVPPAEFAHALRMALAAPAGSDPDFG